MYTHNLPCCTALGKSSHGTCSLPKECNRLPISLSLRVVDTAPIAIMMSDRITSGRWVHFICNRARPPKLVVICHVRNEKDIGVQ